MGLPYFTALLIGAFVVVFYTFLGGFSAVSMTDFIQGTMMFFTVIYIPVAATIVLGGPAPTMASLAGEGKDFFSFFPESLGGMSLIIMILSSLGWGLGYFGQPHILVRFMAISNPKELKKSTQIAVSWVLLSLTFAVAIGIVGKAYLPMPLENANAERVFIITAETLSQPVGNSGSWLRNGTSSTVMASGPPFRLSSGEWSKAGRLRRNRAAPNKSSAAAGSSSFHFPPHAWRLVRLIA